MTNNNQTMTLETYNQMYQESITNPDDFWAKQAEEFLTWDNKWESVSSVDFNTGNIEWFKGATINASYNCIDRHLPQRANQTAIIWEGDEGEVKNISYQQLHDEVARFANGLKELGVGKGDRVIIYMPMIVEAAYAMLACARIGAIHSVVFGGFSPDSLKSRIVDCDAKVVITADYSRRGGKVVPLKTNVDKALQGCECVQNVVVVKNTGGEIQNNSIDVDYHRLVEKQDAHCEIEFFDAETPLFILYTSGSTGTPKGVLHTTGGYLLYSAITHKYAFNYQEGDVYFCTADVGWITGHSYIVYGPLTNGATTLMFEGVPTYPDASRFWRIVEKHKVNQFYTAPTAIRALMGAGDEFVEGIDLSSLKVLGTVGEPINPEAWRWYEEKIGNGKLPITDTWWQTETGGHMIMPLPNAYPQKPGSAMKPFFGIQPQIVDEKGNVLEGEAEGILVISNSWPGQMRTLYNNHERFMDAYFSTFKGKYFAGDGARRDSDGDYWITGRVDDVLNVSGHRLGTAEIESALVLHQDVSEAAVVGYPHDIKGQGIYAYVSLNHDINPTDELKAELVKLVRAEIGPIATVDKIQFAGGLPKTRSGKIMRRILRKIADTDFNDFTDLGDTSTLAEPQVVDDLISGRVV
jgi:acetyl-CoA synthetase